MLAFQFGLRTAICCVAAGLVIVPLLGALVSRERLEQPYRHRLPLRNSPAHEWACSLFHDTMSRLSVIVITGSNVVDTRGKAVQDTWASVIPKQRLFMFTDGDQLNSIKEAIVLPGTSGSHAGSQKKWPLAFEHFCSNGISGAQDVRATTDWLLVADDDTYVFFPNLLAALISYTVDWPYIIGRGMVFEAGRYLSGGAGYVLSRAAIDRVCGSVDTFIRHHWRSYASDVNMGLFMSSLNITMVSLDGFYPHRFASGMNDEAHNPGGLRTAPDFSGKIAETEVDRPLTHHNVSPDQMRKLHAQDNMDAIMTSCRRG